MPRGASARCRFFFLGRRDLSFRQLGTGALAASGGVLLHAADALASGGRLVLVPDVPILLGLIVLFAVLVAPVNALLFRPIFRVLDARAERITGARERAAKLQTQADEILQRYEQAVREVREDAERQRRERLDESRRETAVQTLAARRVAEGELERARAELDAALTGARASLREQAESLARETAARVLGRSLS